MAPTLGKQGRRFLDEIDAASEGANPGLARPALKLATGGRKTAVMAMIIAWQEDQRRAPTGSQRFTRGFLVVISGVTIRDGLRVLQPNDPDSYYASRELVPKDMLRDVERTKIVITKYHAFLRRETLELSKGGCALLRGQGPDPRTKETEAQMLQGVMLGLMVFSVNYFCRLTTTIFAGSGRRGSRVSLDRSTPRAAACSGSEDRRGHLSAASSTVASRPWCGPESGGPPRPSERRGRPGRPVRAGPQGP